MPVCTIIFAPVTNLALDVGSPMATMSDADRDDPHPSLPNEALAWFVRLRSGEATPEEWRRFEARRASDTARARA